jgi:hypothetical protein
MRDHDGRFPHTKETRVPECLDAKAGNSLFTVSYSTRDSREPSMGRVLERVTERVRSELGYQGNTALFYRDDYAASRGPGWEKGLVEALCRCAVVVAFYSPTYFSELPEATLCCYCGREIGIFAGREPARVANVVPILWDVPTGGVRKMVPPGTMADISWTLDGDLVTPRLQQKYQAHGLRWIWSRQNQSMREDLTLAIAQKILGLHKSPAPVGNVGLTLATARCAFHPEQQVKVTVSELARQVSQETPDPGTLILVYLSKAPLPQSQRDQLEQHGRAMGYLVLVCYLSADQPSEELRMLTRHNGPVLICAGPDALAGDVGQDIRTMLADPGWLGGLLLSGNSSTPTAEPAEGVTVAAQPGDLTEALSQAVASVKRRLMRLGGGDGLSVGGPPLPRV